MAKRPSTKKSAAAAAQEDWKTAAKVPYLVMQSGCLMAAADVFAKIDTETQTRDDIAQSTVRVANRIYERFVELSLERRKNRRIPVDINAKILVDDRTLDCHVLNISPGGAMISPLLALHVGGEIGLKIGRHKPIQARVEAIGAKQTNLSFIADDNERDRLETVVAKIVAADRKAAS